MSVERRIGAGQDKEERVFRADRLHHSIEAVDRDYQAVLLFGRTRQQTLWTWTYAADTYDSKSIRPVGYGRNGRGHWYPCLFSILRDGLQQSGAGWGYRTVPCVTGGAWHELQQKLFAQVVELLEAKGMILKKGTIVVPPSSRRQFDQKQREGRWCGWRIWSVFLVQLVAWIVH